MKRLWTITPSRGTWETEHAGRVVGAVTRAGAGFLWHARREGVASAGGWAPTLAGAKRCAETFLSALDPPPETDDDEDDEPADADATPIAEPDVLYGPELGGEGG